MRTILHADMDAFFAAVEARDDPAIADRPIVVGADPRGGRGRGVVAACNYAAREFGIHSAMPISEAYRRCPDAVYLRPRMKLYAEISERIMARFGWESLRLSYWGRHYVRRFYGTYPPPLGKPASAGGAAVV